MKTIIISIVSLWFVNFAMGQCTVIGGNLSADDQKICPQTATYLTLNNYTGTITSWEQSSNNVVNWTTVSTSSSWQLNQYFPSTGTFLYRVKVTCTDNNNNTYQAYSNVFTIEVSNPVGGTISGGNSNICVGGNPSNLSLSGHFGSITWQFQFNSGSYQDANGGSCNVATTCFPIFPNGAGTYKYRAKVSCTNNPSNYAYSNEVTYQVNNPTQAAICNDPDDLRRAVAKVTISGIPYSFSGFLVNHTAQDGRLLFLTTSHPFTRYNPTQSTLNNATFTWNEDLNSCGGSASPTVTSTGCTVKAIDGFFALLELNAAPDLAELYYLGWDINATDNYSSIFQSAGSIKKGRVSTTTNPTDVSGSFGSGTDNFNESSGSGVFKFSSWSSGNTEKQGRGAPLLAGSSGKKARGVYLGGTEATCGNGPSYFVYLTSNYTNLLSYLRDGSETNTATVRMNYCKPSENLNYVQDYDWAYQVTGSIVSTQPIENGYVVRYKAGSYIELNNGFVSGTDFVAEIDPCLITRTTIAAKTDDVETEFPHAHYTISTELDIKIYPTVIASGNAINIEVADEIQDVHIVFYDLQGKSILHVFQKEMHPYQRYSFQLNSFSSGLYIVKSQSQSISHTQKIIVE
jgi:hypothetical protein